MAKQSVGRLACLASVERSNDDSTASAVAGQADRGRRWRLSILSGNGQTSIDGQTAAVRQSSRLTAGGSTGSATSRVSNDIQSFGASANRVRVTANGSIRLHTQVAATRTVTGVSAIAASAPDSAAVPSSGRTINVAVQRALAGQTAATAHANANTSGTVRTEQAMTGIRAAQPARSSSPYAGNR